MRHLGSALSVGAFLLDVLAVLSPAAALEAGTEQRLPGTAPSNPAAAAVRELGGASAANQAGGGGAAIKKRQDDVFPPARSGVAVGLPMRRAYATLLYSDFIEGTRALGQSLRDSGTTADTVVLVTPDVRQETRERLAQDGWM